MSRACQTRAHELWENGPLFVQNGPLLGARLSVFGENSPASRGRSSTTLEQLTLLRERMPVLIFERVKAGESLRIFKRYQRKLLFLGRMNVVGILLMGTNGYRYFMRSKYISTVHDGLMSLLSDAKLDMEQYRVVDWFQQKNRFIILVTRESAKQRAQ